MVVVKKHPFICLQHYFCFMMELFLYNAEVAVNNTLMSNSRASLLVYNGSRAHYFVGGGSIALAFDNKSLDLTFQTIF